MALRFCLASMVRGAGRVLDSFLAYHFAIGFERAYLFFDDPADPDLSRVEKNPRVTAVPCDARLRECQRRSLRFAALKPDLATEFAARQMLNIESALKLARADGMEWLLHVDVDEAFYPLAGRSAASCFQRLSQRREELATFLNLEALPERLEVDDYFREVTLFKRNPALVPPETDEAQAFWKRRGYFFLAYINGKSAVRPRPGVYPLWAHSFRRLGGPIPGGICPDAVILHYANCGLSRFARKYRLLGDFPDTELGAKRLPFHRAARDCFRRGKRTLRCFYREQVLLTDSAEVRRQLSAGLLERIDYPARVLKRSGPARTL